MMSSRISSRSSRTEAVQELHQERDLPSQPSLAAEQSKARRASNTYFTNCCGYIFVVFVCYATGRAAYSSCCNICNGPSLQADGAIDRR